MPGRHHHHLRSRSRASKQKENQKSKLCTSCKLKTITAPNCYNSAFFRTDIIGENIRISEDRSVAERIQGFSNGHVFLEGLLEVHRYIKIEVQRITKKFWGGFTIGLTSLDEPSIKLEIIKNKWDEQIQETYKFHNLGQFFEPGDTIVICLLCTGELLMRLNNEHPEVLSTLDMSKKYIFFVDVCNSVNEIKAFINDESINMKCEKVPKQNSGHKRKCMDDAQPVRFRSDFMDGNIALTRGGYRAEYFGSGSQNGRVVIEELLGVDDIVGIKIIDVDDSPQRFLEVGLTILDSASIIDWEKHTSNSDEIVLKTYEVSWRNVKKDDGVFIELVGSGHVRLTWRGKRKYSEKKLDPSKIYTVFCNVCNGIRKIEAYMVHGRSRERDISNFCERNNLTQGGNSRSCNTNPISLSYQIAHAQSDSDLYKRKSQFFLGQEYFPQSRERDNLTQEGNSRSCNTNPISQSYQIAHARSDSDLYKRKNLFNPGKRNSLVSLIDPNWIFHPEMLDLEKVCSELKNAFLSYQRSNNENIVSSSHHETTEEPSSSGKSDNEETSRNDETNFTPLTDEKVSNEEFILIFPGNDEGANLSEQSSDSSLQSEGTSTDIDDITPINPLPLQENMKFNSKKEENCEVATSAVSDKGTDDSKVQNENRMCGVPLEPLINFESTQVHKVDDCRALIREKIEDRPQAEINTGTEGSNLRIESQMDNRTHKVDENRSQAKINTTDDQGKGLKLKEQKNTEKLKTGSESPSSKNCVVCLEKEMDTVLYKCGHRCMCYECAYGWYIKGNSRCPLCRMIIQDVIKIFDA